MGGPAGHATIGQASPGGHGGGQGGGQGCGAGVVDPVWLEPTTHAQAIVGQASPALQGGGHGGGHAISVVSGPLRVGPPATAVPAEHGGGQEPEVPVAVSATHGGGQTGCGRLLLLLPPPPLELEAGQGGHGLAGHDAPGGQAGGGHGGMHFDPFGQGPGQGGEVGAPPRRGPQCVPCGPVRRARWCLWRRWWRCFADRPGRGCRAVPPACSQGGGEGGDFAVGGAVVVPLCAWPLPLDVVAPSARAAVAPIDPSAMQIAASQRMRMARTLARPGLVGSSRTWCFGLSPG